MTINSNLNGESTIKMALTNPAHRSSEGSQTPENTRTSGFGAMVSEALGSVSDAQLNADAVFEKMITNPDDVEPADVTIAMAKAEMSLNLTKTIVDRAVKAYNDITSMR
ncbi:MAG: flagellar hook-basal body complex protein FliE [Spirochaetales bacterium]|nr:flagellar hook-basal body complex protein FliE [Spirochaetales bacterium]